MNSPVFDRALGHILLCLSAKTPSVLGSYVGGEVLQKRSLLTRHQTPATKMYPNLPHRLSFSCGTQT
ncbi:hypothetical protein PR003_g11120 [Phytophthora rubi]|uniref:Uncharacterized protein n=1 Tax=Phytophthora rubi TaxID=129364 RepID=A0A6A3PDE5_9STRA|nr:hypothetical protein PR002_g2125 [Phytophthora rubi]KAE9050469.1 hypothetical protein PR001_g2370 [Phytophthora rubi]KAE9339231.1 hypothetical protein PR003_g11120 [Phytophthora rubi]